MAFITYLKKVFYCRYMFFVFLCIYRGLYVLLKQVNKNTIVKELF